MVFLAVCISFEFINGENLRQLLAGIGNQIEITESCTNGNVVLFGYVGGRHGISKVFNNPCVLAVRHTVVAWEKVVFLIEPLTAAAAHISSLAKM